MKLAERVTIAALTTLAILSAASVAIAYPNELATYPEGVPRSECVDCHGASEQGILNPGDDPDLLAARRKGPHGGYTTGTNKCQTCHFVHRAPAGGSKLLPGATIKATCESCHDGTGGRSVYGTIEARTGQPPAAAHRVEDPGHTTIPGGDPSGGDNENPGLTGPGGTLTCSDCHSPHDANTVEPFTGDRLRASVSSETAYTLKTNRLLRQVPTSAETTVAVYGTEWCASCHKGRIGGHDPAPGDPQQMQNHPVMQGDHYYYDWLPVITGVGSYETTMGTLGQSNRGYVMPDDPDAAPGPGPGGSKKTALQDGWGPLCQQCHEDARAVGPTEGGANPTLTGAEQEFRATKPHGTEESDNPRFQVFPHESDAEYFLVRPAEDNSLCKNCHAQQFGGGGGGGGG